MMLRYNRFTNKDLKKIYLLLRGKLMLIQCTKALRYKLGIKDSELAPSDTHLALPESLMAWHANIITVNRKKR